MNSFGNKLKSIREKKGMTQAELSKKSGITETSLSRYENGLREPKAVVVMRLAAALKCDIKDLL